MKNVVNIVICSSINGECNAMVCCLYVNEYTVPFGFTLAKFKYTECMVTFLGCKAGYFGWGCRFRCDCLQGGNCDSTTGHCETGCADDRWGVGCLLGNCFSYVINC